MMDEHNYKWFSCLDDGRNETPMTAIPNDEPPILENLEKFDQRPKAYKSRVYVPNTEGAPGVLPSNYKRFTISIEDLTPRLILRLANVNTGDSNTLRRVGQALKNTVEDGKASRTSRSYYRSTPGEVQATITVKELEQDEFVEMEDGTRRVADADEVEEAASENEHVRQVTYEMEADKALEKAAESLIMLR